MKENLGWDAASELCQVTKRKVVGKKEFAKGCEAIGFEGEGSGCAGHLTLQCWLRS